MRQHCVHSMNDSTYKNILQVHNIINIICWVMFSIPLRREEIIMNKKLITLDGIGLHYFVTTGLILNSCIFD